MPAELSLPDLSDPQATLAVVLGSGLGSVVDSFPCLRALPYEQIPSLSAATVPGHAGRLVLAQVGKTRVWFAQGRRHLYEGISAYEATALIRLLSRMGVRRVILTNAAGAIQPNYSVGDFMLIRDHLNLQGTTPLLGGPHFIDMSEVYSLNWRHAFHSAAKELEIPCHEGVYAALLGPQYETPSEIRMLKVLGADAVGMSTVPEAIQARALKMEVLGISMLTNMAAGITGETLSHEEVVRVGKKAAENLTKWLERVLA